MGAVFFAFVMLFVGSGGLIGTVLSIIGLVTGRKTAKNGKIIVIISTVVLAVSALLLLVAVAFFGFIIYTNAIPPEDFVKTEIRIEEDGFQSESFHADGVVYEALNWSVEVDKSKLTPVFYYTVPGFLNGSQSGNYYTVPNSGGFDLVYGGWDVFCPSEQRTAVEAYYDDPAKLRWHLYTLDGLSEPLPNELEEQLRLGWHEANSPHRTDGRELYATSYREIDVEQYSGGLKRCEYCCDLVEIDGTLYYALTYDYDHDEDGVYVYGVPLDKTLAEQLRTYIK